MEPTTVITETLEKLTLESTAVESQPIIKVDVTRHGGKEAPTEPPPKPILGGTFELDKAVFDGELLIAAWPEYLFKQDKPCRFQVPKLSRPENMACLSGAKQPRSLPNCQTKER
jgi:hypothetical protein